MLQAIVRKGKVVAEDIPDPLIENGYLLIKVVNSCISAGTEMASVKASGKSIIQRVKESPDLLNKALDILRNKGFTSLRNKVSDIKVDGKILGYSVSGIVIDTGKGVDQFEIGERVAAAGAGFANHAEFVKVPVNLVVKIPENVSFIDASTTTLGAIAIQGVRRADLSFGEFAVVFGAGIIGLISLQILTASGIRVAVIDIDINRLQKAKELGAEIVINTNENNAINIISTWTNGYGADTVIFTAATKDSQPLSESFKMCKRKGQVVLVGVSGMEINRADMYSKELELKISTSYGPGRYDEKYEIEGIDYPYGYVRWTENRNMQEYLRLIKENKISLDTLIHNVYDISDVEKAYQSFENSATKPLIIILDYGQPNLDKSGIEKTHTVFLTKEDRPNPGIIRVGLVGAGNFALSTHLPIIMQLKDKFKLHCVLNRSGHKAKFVAEKFGAAYATTDIDKVLNDKDVDLIIITTRHDSHAEYVLKSLNAGKHVFVEKPLAVNEEQLNYIRAQILKMPEQRLLLTGFNRRFSPFIKEIKKHTDTRINPLFINYRMNAGYIPLDHWVHESGGRIIGELCHIIDLMIYLTGSTVDTIYSESITPNTGKFQRNDNKVVSLKFKDGSLANLTYLAVGSKELDKEYMEIHYDEKSIVLENYQKIKGFGLKLNKLVSKVPSKGILEEYLAIYSAINSNPNKFPITLEEQIHTTELTFLI